MPPLDNFSVNNTTVHREGKSDLSSPNGQKTFHRVFLYLQALHIPEEKALELAREALRIANSNQRDTTENHSTREAMRVLRGLLTEQPPSLPKELIGQKEGYFHESLSRLSSMPPLNRGVMVPAAIDLVPWRTFLVNIFKKATTIVSRPLNFLILFIFLIILFVLLTFWK
jgi:hypothetical protein